MIPHFKNVFKLLESSNQSYVIGADSLVGISEGNLFQYSHHLRLFMFPMSRLNWFRLGLKFLLQGMILKPKITAGRVFFKLRFRDGFLHKRSEFVIIFPLVSRGDQYCAWLGGRDICFSNKELDPSQLDSILHEDISVSVPRNMKRFVQSYSKELMGSFYQNYNVSFDSESEKRAVDFMHKNVAVMQEAGIVFWVEGGTLLGALRDQKLIPWDHDLDFGMRFQSKQQMKQLIRKLRRHFYVSVKGFPKTDKIWNLGDYRVLKIYPRKLLFLREDLCLDLFVYYEGHIPEQDETVYKYVVWNRNAYHRKVFFDQPEFIEFYGKDIPVPANPEDFIAVKYGQDWRTPKKEWNVALDDGSIYKTG